MGRITRPQLSQLSSRPHSRAPEDTGGDGNFLQAILHMALATPYDVRVNTALAHALRRIEVTTYDGGDGGVAEPPDYSQMR
jgi:hypothetical protein